MAKPLPHCEYRVVMPRGETNVCQAGVYGGKVTDGMCRTCLRRGDKPLAIARVPRIAIGDLVETVLTFVGITESRVRKWTRLQDCNCKRRAKWLNEWGFARQAQLEQWLNKAARWCGL